MARNLWDKKAGAVGKKNVQWLMANGSHDHVTKAIDLNQPNTSRLIGLKELSLSGSGIVSWRVLKKDSKK